MLSNAYFLAKFRFDTAENEPAKDLQKFAKFANFADPNPLIPNPAGGADHPSADRRVQRYGRRARGDTDLHPSGKSAALATRRCNRRIT